jgi:hypothetical protein
MGHAIAACLESRVRHARAFQTFRAFVSGPEPDLGHAHFIATERHEFEVDLWKLVRTMSFIRTRLEEAA